MKLTKSISFAILGAMILFLSSCSSSGSTSSSQSKPSFNGKWVFVLMQNPGAIDQNEIDANFTQSGVSISSDSSNTVDGFPCVFNDEPPSDTTVGSVTGRAFNLTFTLHSGQPDAQTLALTGTLTPDRSQINGTYTWSAGPCNSLQTGIFDAAFIASLTGQYTGVLINSDTGITDPITGMITEDPDFQTSGSFNVMNDSCLSTISPAPTQAGYSIGQLTYFFGTDGTNTVGFSGTTIKGAAIINGVWTISPGCTNEGGGAFDFTNVATSGAPAPANNGATDAAAQFLAAPPSPQLMKNFQALMAARHTTK
jgi:hypothetical protein